MTLQISAAVLLALHITASTAAQNSVIKGTITENRRNRPLAGVHLRLINQSDTTYRYTATTDTGGHFSFSNIRTGSFLLEATYVGYEKFTKIIPVSTNVIDIGTVAVSQSTIPMNEFVVEGRIPPAVQKSDTTEYNAKAFKVNRDASTEDLVTKMPGVTIESGTVKAQGENVQQVLVDGRPFFGEDPTLALRNFPAEVVDKVQVFDKLSDQAQLTGFDDGQRIKTMNIVTRSDRRQGEFGRLNGGYGTDDRYISSGNFNSFQASQRLSFIGLTNNINQQNFSLQDLLGVTGGGNQRGGFQGGGMFGRGGRSGGGRIGGGGGPQFGQGGNSNNFLVGQQSGISSAHSAGVNYADSLWSGVAMTGSYFFNLTDNRNPQTLNRQYVLSSDSNNFYNENSDAEKKNYNHRLNFRVESAMDSSNSLILTPQISFQNNHSSSSATGIASSSSNAELGEAQNDNETSANGYSMQGHVVFRHKFPTVGRTISVDVGVGSNRKRNTNTLHSLDEYFNNTNPNDTIVQQSNIMTSGVTLSSGVVYTEPMGSNSLLQINYNPAYNRNTSDNKTYNFNALLNEYSNLNDTLSNTFDNTYVTNNAGFGYRLRGQSFNLTAGVSYQVAALRGEQSFPQTEVTAKTLYSILPNVMLNYELSSRRNVRVSYRTSTASPTIAQLQNVIDNSNPLLLSSGNPDLRQSYSHTFLTRLMLANPDNAQSILLFLYGSYTRDYIGNLTFIAQQDTTLANGARLLKGSQLTMPENLDGNWNVRTLLTYGFPVDLISSNLNMNIGVTYARTPGQVNDLLNMSGVTTFSPGFVLGSNISEDVDFTLSYTANFNNVRNSAQSNLDNDYFSHTAGLKFNWIFWEGIVLKSDASNILYSGLTNGLNQHYFLWNVSLGKKIFENQRGEVSFNVYDILNQNRNINRTVTETYIEDATTHVLNRYYMLTFTYNLRQFHE